MFGFGRDAAFREEAAAAVAVDAQECGRYGYRDAFVSINERVVLRQTFPQSRRFLN